MSSTHTTDATMAALMAEFDADQARETRSTEGRHGTFRLSSHRRELVARDLTGLAKMAIGAAVAGLFLALVVAL